MDVKRVISASSVGTVPLIGFTPSDLLTPTENQIYNPILVKKNQSVVQIN